MAVQRRCDQCGAQEGTWQPSARLAGAESPRMPWVAVAVEGQPSQDFCSHACVLLWAADVFGGLDALGPRDLSPVRRLWTEADGWHEAVPE